ncbi:Hsp70 family protein [Aestuariibaculum sp. YM273]|uniref:Hsp70 family protein n=1 Tax=Aestuariibaculum sp. YM273 TaxID=3070659 RepID=UPI0027DD8D1C|nr:Hsp70 family protein [Aestuariibaculum sp. YM273]WMI64102.1 Hsp70 family protein [Aestuariibaculum sp. YM273]
MKKAIGIDLGTSNSVIAFKDTVLKIIRNKENEELTRSCIGLRKDEILIGRTAYQLLKTDPLNTILSVKRLMGGAIKDKMVQDMIDSSYYKYGITSLKGGTDDAVAVLLGGKQYTPEQLSSEILKKLKSDAEEKLGDEVTHAVITVPAYFTEKQKNATRIAAQLAGLKVQKLLAEPTAAAIAYGVDNLKAGEAKTVLIYDFGGGTFDLSILNIVDGQYMEAGTGGDRWLGGDDLDRALQTHILQRISKDYNISNINTLIENLTQREKFKFEAKFREEVENIKMQLSSSNTAQLIMDGFEDENGDWIDFDLSFTREEFEKLAKPFIERSIELIEILLKEVGYDISMIDNILLVGGTSCIPLVKQMLSEKYGNEKIKISEKPMLAISEGAGILSHRLGDDYEPPIEGETSIAEISYSTNHNYFIELKDDYDRIIEKQVPLPCNVLRNYKTTVNNQKVVKVGIYADVEGGEKEKQTMGFFTIEEDLPVGSDIVLDFTLGIDEVFDVKAYPKINKGKSKNIVLARGNKDSKTLDFLSSSLEKIMGSSFTEAQREYFFKSAKREIEQINNLGIDNYDSEHWDEIGTTIFTSFEQAERVSDAIDEEELAILFATILINEYPDLIVSEDVDTMRSLLSRTKNDHDPLQRIQAIQKLKEITDEYPVLISLFTIKMSSDNAAKENPSDGHRLLQMHDEIVSHFKNRRKDQAFDLLDEAIELRDKYSKGKLDLGGSIHLGK